MYRIIQRYFTFRSYKYVKRIAYKYKFHIYNRESNFEKYLVVNTEGRNSIYVLFDTQYKGFSVYSKSPAENTNLRFAVLPIEKNKDKEIFLYVKNGDPELFHMNECPEWLMICLDIFFEGEAQSLKDFI